MYLQEMPQYKNKLLERHPEVCFAKLNSTGRYKEPVYENKKTEEGMAKRISLFVRYYDKTEDVVKYMLDDPKPCRMKDDVIDALCLAVTGMLSLKKGFNSIPEESAKDSSRIKMQMFYTGILQVNSR